jgi:hypothetical protein
MNGVAQHRQHDPVVVDHLDWIEAGRNPTTATQWSMLDSLFGSGSSRGTTTRLVPNESSRCASNSTSSAGHKKKRRLRCRMIQPQDREVIQRLHEEWFPVLYQDEFFDELVQGRMIGSGDPLFTRVAVEEDNENNDDQHPPPERIVGCVVGSFVNANLLSKFMQELLVNDIGTHPRLFYIMTLGFGVDHGRRSFGGRRVRRIVRRRLFARENRQRGGDSHVRKIGLLPSDGD